MNARLQAALLLVFGAALLRLAVGDVLLRYVRPGARPVVIAAALALVLVSAASLLRRAGAEASGTHGSRATWLLLGPVLAIALVAPPALGVLTASRPPTTPPRPAAGFAPLPDGEPVSIRLPDVVLRTVWHAGGTLRGRTIRVIGFVARSTRRGFVLARLVITCCAADARPYDIDVTSRDRAPPTGAWVAVTGRYAGAGPDGAVVPAVRASSVVAVPQPANPYG